LIENDYGAMHDQLIGFCEEDSLAAVFAVHPEVRWLWENRNMFHGPIGINGINLILHVTFESIVENQIIQGDPPEAGQAVERLINSGLHPHTARGSVANLLVPHILPVISEKKPFDKDAYARRLNLLNAEIDMPGRNQPCPCGSGKKFKKCCLPVADSLKAPKNAGTLILGAGHYAYYDYLFTLEPDALLIQLENSAHIAKYLEEKECLEGAEIYLQENVNRAERDFLKNALHDFQHFCLRHPRYAARGVEITEKLLELDGDEEEKKTLLCDKADFLHTAMGLQKAMEEYQDLIEKYPGDNFIRYRKALLLDDIGRLDEAVDILSSIVESGDEEEDKIISWAKDLLESISEE